MRLFHGCLAALLAVLAPANLVEAAFHLMQIEQVIGGVNGDTTAQAVQLRMRSAGQNFVASGKLTAVDAAGANEVLLQGLTTNVANGALGSRVLIATPNFANYTNIPLVADFIMTPIPVSYLAAGQVRFMNNSTTIYWSVSWESLPSADFTGSTLGSSDNDDSPAAQPGDFGPPVTMSLPSSSLQALQFTGAVNALSTSNSLQYVLTPGASVWVNNAGTSFTLVTPPLPGDFNDDDVVDAADYVVWRKNETNNNPLPNDNGLLTQAERFDLWRANFGDTAGSGSGDTATIPEPVSWVLLLLAAMFAARRRLR